MKFKVGDKVVVKKQLISGVDYGSFPFVNSMKERRGKVVTIREINLRRMAYEIAEDGGDAYWTDDMLEPITDPLADKIQERNHKHTNGLTDDKVNSPSHYTRGDIEVIEIIKQLTQGYDPFEAYLVGNTIKYLARANYKENKQQDLEKAEWHINKLLEESE